MTDIINRIPLYRQIAQAVKADIARHRLNPGDRISVRGLMSDYKAGKKAVVLALELLNEEGIAVSIPRTGTVISPDARNIILNTNTPDWHKLSASGLHKPNRSFVNTVDNKYEDTETRLSGYKYGFCEEEFHVYTPIRQALDRIEKDGFAEIMNINNKKGLYWTCEAVAEHVKAYGIETTPENIVLFNNSAQACNTIIYSYMRHGSNLYTMYTGLVGISENISTVGANRYWLDYDKEGISPEDLLKKVNPKKHNMLCITPVNQTPTGLTMSGKRRDEILEISQRLQLPIMELDLFRDVWVKPPPRPLKSDDENDQIIYIGGFSTMANSLIQGAWAIAPKATVARLYDVKFQLYGFTNRFIESLMCILLRNGFYRDNVETVRTLLKGRIHRIQKALEVLKGLAYYNPDSLSHYLWLEFNKGLDTNDFFTDYPEVNVLPGKLFYNSSALSMGSMSEPIEVMEDYIRHFADWAKSKSR